MSKRYCLLALKISTLILWLIPPALARHTNIFTRVTSFTEDLAGGYLVLNTSSLPQSPSINFLAGENNTTVLVADFPNMIWNYASETLVTPDGSGIKQVHIGQVQSNPPILRIAVVATDASSLQKLAFNSFPQELVIKWPTKHYVRAPAAHANLHVYNSSAPKMPPFAPSFRAKQKDVGSSSSLDMLSAATQSDFHYRKSVGVFRKDQTLTSDTFIGPVKPRSLIGEGFIGPINPNFIGPIKPSQQSAVNSNFIGPINPYQHFERTPIEHNSTIAIANESPLELKLNSTHPIHFSSFRLHSPERYIVDFDDFPELADAQAPELSRIAGVKDIRLGHPQDDTEKTRIVFDLTTYNQPVKESISTNQESLNFVFPSNFIPAHHLHMPAHTTLVIDAGHGGSDPGAQRGDIQEKEITLGITEKLRRHLIADGAKIIMTRSDDTFVSLQDRVAITNNTNPDAFISVHINSLESDSDIHGIETYYQTNQSIALAEAIHVSLVNALQAPDRFVRKARFYVITRTSVPAILAEVGFISNKEERLKLISSDYQERIAGALESGVILYLNEHTQVAGRPTVPSKMQSKAHVLSSFNNDEEQTGEEGQNN